MITRELSIIDNRGNILGSMRKSYLVKFVNSKEKYEVNYLASHQSKSGNREDGFFQLKGEDLTENQIFQLFLQEKL